MPNELRSTWTYVVFFKGVDIKEVQEIVETHLKNMLLKHFDPRKS